MPRKKETGEVLEPDRVDDEPSTAIVKHQAGLAKAPLPTDINIQAAKEKFAAIQAFQKLVQAHLHEDLDYGVIPGTKKKTLLKPGAEKIAKLFDLADTFEIIEKVEEWDKGFFYYTFRCRLVSLLTGQVVSEGVGSCNSKESKYRWNWVAADKLPRGVDPAAFESRGTKRTLFEFDFAIGKAETSGRYGKPAEYWDMWRAAIRANKAKAMERKTRDGSKILPGYELVVDETQYRIQNEDPFSLVNTIQKMAKKRAMVDAALSVGRLSELFTQDLEDFHEDAYHAPAEPEENGAGGQGSKPQATPPAKEPPKREPPKPKAKPEPKPEPAAKPAGDAGPDPDWPEDEEPAAAEPEKDLPTTPPDHKAETIKAIKDHLKITFGDKAYERLYREFKAWLGDVMGPKLSMNFVGLEFGNWSLNAGDLEALIFLYEKRMNAVSNFQKYRDRKAGAQSK